MATTRVQVRKKLGRYHHGQLRGALVLAAERYIAKTGTVDVPLREVAKLAGVSHAAAYRHFESKTALLAEVARRGFESLAAALSDSVAAAKGAETGQQLEEASVAYVRFALDSAGAFRVMFHSSLKPFTSHPGLPEAALRALDVLRALVDHQGGDLAVMSTWAAIHGHAMLLIDGQLEGPFGVTASQAEATTRAMMRWLSAVNREKTTMTSGVSSSVGLRSRP